MTHPQIGGWLGLTFAMAGRSFQQRLDRWGFAIWVVPCDCPARVTRTVPPHKSIDGSFPSQPIGDFTDRTCAGFSQPESGDLTKGSGFRPNEQGHASGWRKPIAEQPNGWYGCGFNNSIPTWMWTSGWTIIDISKLTSKTTPWWNILDGIISLRGKLPLIYVKFKLNHIVSLQIQSPTWKSPLNST